MLLLQSPPQCGQCLALMPATKNTHQGGLGPPTHLSSIGRHDTTPLRSPHRLILSFWSPIQSSILRLPRRLLQYPGFATQSQFRPILTGIQVFLGPVRRQCANRPHRSLNIPRTLYLPHLLSTLLDQIGRGIRHLRRIHPRQLLLKLHGGLFLRSAQLPQLQPRHASAYMELHLASGPSMNPRVSPGGHTRHHETTPGHAGRPLLIRSHTLGRRRRGDRLNAETPLWLSCRRHLLRLPAQTGFGMTRASPRRSGMRARSLVHMDTGCSGLTSAASTGRAARSCRRR